MHLFAVDTAYQLAADRRQRLLDAGGPVAAGSAAVPWMPPSPAPRRTRREPAGTGL